MDTNRQAGARTVVFVHGIRSGPQVWDPLVSLLEADPAFKGVTLLRPEYSSPRKRVDPRHQTPNLNTLADQLSTYVRNRTTDDGCVVLFAHSQGGLIAQRMIQRLVTDGSAAELDRIARMVLVACPNSGSKFFLDLRRIFMRNPQEKSLRPLDEDVAETHRFVVKWAAETGAARPFLIRTYYGANDNIVPRVSAGGLFGRPDVLPGDHSSIVRPRSRDDDRYVAFAGELRSACQPTSPPDPELRVEVPEPRVQAPKRNVSRVVLLVVAQRPGERARRLLVKPASEDWRLLPELPYMLPSVPVSASVDEIRHDASVQLGLEPDALELELRGSPVWTSNMNPSMGDRSGDYVFQLAVVTRVDGVVDVLTHFADVGDRPGTWATLNELTQHEATRTQNGDIYRCIRELWGSNLERLTPVLSLP